MATFVYAQPAAAQHTAVGAPGLAGRVPPAELLAAQPKLRQQGEKARHGRGSKEQGSRAGWGIGALGAACTAALRARRRGSCALAATADGEAKAVSSSEVEAEDAEAEPEVEEAPKRPKRVFDPTKQVGVTAPLGYFDPLGFCKMGDRDGFRNYRVAELKHGRVAMLASAGLLLQHFYHPFIFDNLSPGIWAATETPAKEGLFMLFLTAGAVEVFVWTEDPYKEPGNYGDPLGVNIYDLDMRNRELNNGRLAMFTTIGQIAVQLYTGLDSIEAVGGPPADQFGDF